MSIEYGARRRLRKGEEQLLDQIRRIGIDKAYDVLSQQDGQNDATYNERVSELAEIFAEDWTSQLPQPITVDRSPVIVDARSAAFFGDVHGIYYDKPAFVAAITDAKKRNPECVVLNGDFMDCHAVSHWERDWDKRNFVKEIEFAQAMLKAIRGQFPKSRIIYVEGNHEAWYSKRLAKKMPEIAGHKGVQLESLLELQNYGVEYVKGARPLKFGKLHTIHGHEINAGGRYVAANKLAKVGGNILFNHHHRTQEETVRLKFTSETIAGFAVGCLCSLSMNYDPHPDANHGYAFVEVAADKNFKVDNIRIENGGVL